ncbi:MAG: DUF433 domain-containing protein [Acidobacteriota bacterium]
MSKDYIEKRNGGYYVAGTRISLDSIVYGYWRGESPEEIIQSFPLLKLEQAYGAIAFYLTNKTKIDAYLKVQEAAFETKRQTQRDADPAFYQRIAEAKRRLQTTK